MILTICFTDGFTVAVVGVTGFEPAGASVIDATDFESEGSLAATLDLKPPAVDTERAAVTAADGKIDAALHDTASLRSKDTIVQPAEDKAFVFAVVSLVEDGDGRTGMADAACTGTAGMTDADCVGSECLRAETRAI